MSFTPFARYRNFTLANLKALLEVYPDMARSIPWEEAKDFAEANLKVISGPPINRHVSLVWRIEQKVALEYTTIYIHLMMRILQNILYFGLRHILHQIHM